MWGKHCSFPHKTLLELQLQVITNKAKSCGETL
jgi:hypothetical protein